jgi:hypothetical protein
MQYLLAEPSVAHVDDGSEGIEAGDEWNWVYFL